MSNELVRRNLELDFKILPKHYFISYLECYEKISKKKAHLQN